MSEHSGRGKLDAGLAELIRESFIAKDETVPVVVSAAGERLDDAVEAVRASGGTVRHVLERLNAVAAWVPLGAIEGLSQREPVEEIELDQPVSVA